MSKLDPSVLDMDYTAEADRIAQRLRDYGAEPWPLGPAAYDAFMRDEVAKWAPVVRASGAQID